MKNANTQKAELFRFVAFLVTGNDAMKKPFYLRYAAWVS
jgi:hypothetical protein